jgi:hypothetical protein
MAAIVLAEIRMEYVLNAIKHLYCLKQFSHSNDRFIPFCVITVMVGQIVTSCSVSHNSLLYMI